MKRMMGTILRNLRFPVFSIPLSICVRKNQEKIKLKKMYSVSLTIFVSQGASTREKGRAREKGSARERARARERENWASEKGCQKGRDRV
jgi:hypothetical protein